MQEKKKRAVKDNSSLNFGGGHTAILIGVGGGGGGGVGEGGKKLGFFSLV